MPNTTVPAAVTGLPVENLNRRALLAGTAATAATAAAVAAGTAFAASPLVELIEAHRRARSAQDAAIAAMDEAGRAGEWDSEYAQVAGAEHAALAAVCAHVCRSMDEVAIKGRYLQTIVKYEVLHEELVDDIVNSMAGAGT